MMRARRPDEGGAIAIMTALLAVVLFTIAALALDISSQVDQRQGLHDKSADPDVRAVHDDPLRIEPVQLLPDVSLGCLPGIEVERHATERTDVVITPAAVAV